MRTSNARSASRAWNVPRHMSRCASIMRGCCTSAPSPVKARSVLECCAAGGGNTLTSATLEVYLRRNNPLSAALVRTGSRKRRMRRHHRVRRESAGRAMTRQTPLTGMKRAMYRVSPLRRLEKHVYNAQLCYVAHDAERSLSNIYRRGKVQFMCRLSHAQHGALTRGP